MNEDIRQQPTVYRLCESIPILGKTIIVVWDYTDKAVEEFGTFQGRMRGFGVGLLLVAALVVPVMVVPALLEFGRRAVSADLGAPSKHSEWTPRWSLSPHVRRRNDDL
jgi:hypothetical protein